MKILIPARRNSKGLPHKNRRLLKYTLDTIPKKFHKVTYVSTDDEVIMNRLVDTDFKIHVRSSENARDESSTRSLVEEFIEEMSFEEEDITMLYLTYPERTFEEVLEMFSFFRASGANSMLCKKQVLSHPYLCMYELADHRGKQIIQHDLFRRQEYPKCFEISHYVSMFKSTEVKNLNNNMYNESTVFYNIGQKIDVDTKKDMRRFEEHENQHQDNC